MVVAWTRVVADKAVLSGQIVDVFLKKSQQDLLMN